MQSEQNNDINENVQGVKKTENGQNNKPLSKNAMKKMQKALQKSKKNRSTNNTTDIDPEKYYFHRSGLIKTLPKTHQINPYPNKFNTLINHVESFMSISNFRFKYSKLKTNEHNKNDLISLAGRVDTIRTLGSSLVFYKIMSDDNYVQILLQEDNWKGEEPFNQQTSLIKRGDVIGATGYPGISKSGELSLYPSNVKILAPCLRMLPGHRTGLKEKEIRYRKRYLDLICNPENKQIFYIRSQIINYIRRFFDQRGFLEVETPILNVIPGGAIAKPFVTKHNELNLPMYMRIAPELYLKQLIIGGFDRVYEIGRLFRNEGIDFCHNPEFTTCEFYWAYKDYKDLMSITEELISSLVFAIKKSYIIQVSTSRIENSKNSETNNINFEPPFQRIDFISGIEKEGNFKIPLPLSSEETNSLLIKKCEEFKINCPPPLTTIRLLDRLCEHFIESHIVNPTFIINHPAIMSPLSKSHEDNPEITERFELFVNGKELCNAFTELNDPVVQKDRFLSQVKNREQGDDESMAIDNDYILALEYGLPPTAGWGLGIDRLTMLLTNQVNIKEVLLFPAMKPVK